MTSKWKQCTLADLGEIVGGATPSTKNESYYGGDVAWITPKDLSTFQGRFISRGERNITTEGLKNSSARLMPPHSVLFTSRAPIGYVAIAENEVCTNQGFKSIVPNPDTDYLFLYYLLVHNRDRIENMGSGTTFKEVSGSVMKQISVSVPSDIEEQRAIAAVLGALDDKIENNTKINNHLVA
jgi:type I restriction enzyme S subunit